METYVTVNFWLGVVGIFILICMACFTEYPKVKTEKIGEVIFRLIFQFAFVAWSGFLLFLH